MSGTVGFFNNSKSFAHILGRAALGPEAFPASEHMVGLFFPGGTADATRTNHVEGSVDGTIVGAPVYRDYDAAFDAANYLDTHLVGAPDQTLIMVSLPLAVSNIGNYEDVGANDTDGDSIGFMAGPVFRAFAGRAGGGVPTNAEMTVADLDPATFYGFAGVVDTTHATVTAYRSAGGALTKASKAVTSPQPSTTRTIKIGGASLNTVVNRYAAVLIYQGHVVTDAEIAEIFALLREYLTGRVAHAI